MMRLTKIERQYLRNYIYSQRRIMIMCLIIMFVLMNNFMQIGGIFTAIFNIVITMSYSNNNAYDNTALSTLVMCTCFLSFIIPLFQFRFIMKRSSCDLYLSLPITRKRLFMLHFISGGVFMVGTCFLVYFISIFSSSYTLDLFYYCLVGGMILLVGVALYSLFCWIIVKCNTMVDYVMVSASYILFPIILFITMVVCTQFLSKNIYIADEFTYMTDRFFDTTILWMMVNLLSPVWLMRSIFTVFANDVRSMVEVWSCLLSVFLWLCIAYVLFVQGMRTFSNRKGEECEQRTNNWATYPILIPLITLCLLFIALSDINFWIGIPIIFVMYIIMNFIANRSIHIKFNKIIQFVIILAVAGGFIYTCYATNLFWLVVEKPELEEVENVRLRVTYLEETILSAEDIELYGILNHKRATTFYSDETSDKDMIEKAMKLQDLVMDAHVDVEEDMTDLVVSFEYNKGRIYRGYKMSDKEDIQEIQNILQTLLDKGLLQSADEYDPRVYY